MHPLSGGHGPFGVASTKRPNVVRSSTATYSPISQYTGPFPLHFLVTGEPHTIPLPEMGHGGTQRDRECQKIEQVSSVGTAAGRVRDTSIALSSTHQQFDPFGTEHSRPIQIEAETHPGTSLTASLSVAGHRGKMSRRPVVFPMRLQPVPQPAPSSSSAASGSIAIHVRIRTALSTWGHTVFPKSKTLRSNRGFGSIPSPGINSSPRIRGNSTRGGCRRGPTIPSQQRIARITALNTSPQTGGYLEKLSGPRQQVALRNTQGPRPSITQS